MILRLREKKVCGFGAICSRGSRESDGHVCSWRKKLSARKETSDGVALGLDLMLPLLCFSGRSARREVKQATVDTRLGGTANRVRAGILYEGLMNKHED